MKLAHILKPGGSYELHLVNGTVVIIVPGQKVSVILEKADDAEQLVHLSTIVPSGRHKGERAKTVIPYGALVKVVCA